MLIRKQVTGEAVVSHYNSSNLLVSEYNQLSRDLIITFKNGGVYKYDNVSASDYMRFEMADSQGKVLNSSIKPTHDFTRLEDVNSDELNEKINSIKLDNLKELQDEIKADAFSLGDSEGFDLVLAKRVYDQLGIYFEKLK
jgi:hypothetical protein|tara:strand:- start:346 stop:765 length:420 start_codon:yes stop_codon:yes gene_type:complete